MTFVFCRAADSGTDLVVSVGRLFDDKFDDKFARGRRAARAAA